MWSVGVVTPHPSRQRYLRRRKIHKKRRSLPRYFRRHELKRLFSVIDNERDLLIFRIMLTGGLRTQETLNLNIPDISFDTGEVTIWRGKGEKDRVVVLPLDLIKDLKKWLGKRREGRRRKGPIFISERKWGKHKPGRRLEQRWPQKRFRLYLKKAGIDHVNWRTVPHALRHSHAVHALEAGVSLTSVQHQLGHENIVTTNHYTRIVDQDRRNAYREHKPFAGLISNC